MFFEAKISVVIDGIQMYGFTPSKMEKVSKAKEKPM